MGRWSYELDGSDNAADFISGIQDTLCGAAGISLDTFTDEQDYQFTPEQVEKINTVIDTLASEFEEPSDSDDIASGDALIVMELMSNGIKIPDELKQSAMADLKSISTTKKNPSEEKEHAALVLKKLIAYKNTPIDTGGNGLILAILNHVAEGKTGLVNKEPLK